MLTLLFARIVDWDLWPPFAPCMGRREAGLLTENTKQPFLSWGAEAPPHRWVMYGLLFIHLHSDQNRGNGPPSSKRAGHFSLLSWGKKALEGTDLYKRWVEFGLTAWINETRKCRSFWAYLRVAESHVLLLSLITMANHIPSSSITRRCSIMEQFSWSPKSWVKSKSSPFLFFFFWLMGFPSCCVIVHGKPHEQSEKFNLCIIFYTLTR